MVSDCMGASKSLISSNSYALFMLYQIQIRYKTQREHPLERAFHDHKSKSASEMCERESALLLAA